MNTQGLNQSARPVEDSRIGNPSTVSARKPETGEDQFRLLVEGVKDYAIFMLDPKGHIISWNAGAQRIKGYTAEEIIGQHFSRFYPKEDRERGKPDQGLAIATAAGRFEDEGWRLRKDGTGFLANVVITALWDKPGWLRGFAKVTRDITERKRAEEAVRQSESRLKTMMDNSPAVIFIKDLAGRYLQVNRQFEKAFGLTHEAILGRTDLEIFPREQAEAYRAHDALVMQSGVPCQFEEVASYVNGEHFNIVSKFPLLDDAGNAYALCGMAIDISERVQAEESLRGTRFTLQSIFDAAPVAVLSLDLKGRITHWSRGAERMFGWTATEAHGRICPTVPPDGLEDFYAMLARVVRDGPETGLVRYRQKKSGERIHASLCPAPLRDADGKIVGIRVILEDVTERVRAQQALKDGELSLKSSYAW